MLAFYCTCPSNILGKLHFTAIFWVCGQSQPQAFKSFSQLRLNLIGHVAAWMACSVLLRRISHPQKLRSNHRIVTKLSSATWIFVTDLSARLSPMRPVAAVDL